MPGPAARPAALKLLNGRTPDTDSGGRKVEDPPPFARRPPDPPLIVRNTPEALAQWEHVVPELARLQLLKEEDLAALTSFCMCWARLVEASEDINEHGVVIISDKGARVRNPACGVADSASRELRAWVMHFGLSPSAEGQLVAPKAPDADADDAFD